MSEFRQSEPEGPDWNCKHCGEYGPCGCGPEVFGCTGRPSCSVGWHVHGCFSDDGDCNEPEQHLPEGPPLPPPFASFPAEW